MSAQPFRLYLFPDACLIQNVDQNDLLVKILTVSYSKANRQTVLKHAAIALQVIRIIIYSI